MEKFTLERLLDAISNMKVGELQNLTASLKEKISEDGPGGHASGTREPVGPRVPVLERGSALKFPPEQV